MSDEATYAPDAQGFPDGERTAGSASLGRRAWSEEELELLRAHAGSTLKELMELLPGRTDSAIEVRARKLGVPIRYGTSPVRAPDWTEEELAIVREHYADTPMADLLDMLPGRSASAITAKAVVLGIRKSREMIARTRRMTGTGELWTEEELAILRANYADAGKQTLMAMLPGRTYGSIWPMAKTLGLRKSKEGWSRSVSQARPRSSCRRGHGGTVRLLMPEHPKADKEGYVPEHVVVWEEANGRPVPDGCVVCHKDGVKDHNDPENLELITRREDARRRSGIAGHESKRCFSFAAHGIPAGSRIALVRKPYVEAVVAGDRLVEYGGGLWTPAALGKHLLGISYKVPAAKLWTYGGVRLDRLPEAGTPVEG